MRHSPLSRLRCLARAPNSGLPLIVMAISRALLEQIKKLIPPLDGTLHKGQSGQLKLPRFHAPKS